jgi:thymidylate kinase
MSGTLVEVHPLLANAFDALDGADVTWRLLRGEGDLALDGPSAGARAGDVDLLVAGQHIERAHAALTNLGFARLPTWGRGGHRFYLAYDAASDVWARLDLDTQLTYGAHEELPTHAEAACLRRGDRVGRIWRLHPSDAYWTLLLHCLLEKRAFKREYQTRLRELAPAAETGGPLVASFASYLPAGWDAARCVESTLIGDWEALLAIRPAIERAWREAEGWRARRTLLVNGGLGRTTKLLNLLRRRGMGVALLGPDGAGKSTLADGVRDTFFFPTRLVYMGLYQNQTASASSRLPGLGLVTRLTTQWRRYGTALYHRGRGRLVIFDRYTYDHMAPGRSGASAKSRARRWLLAHASPPPNLALVLNVPGEVLYARKGEHDVARLEAQRGEFVALAARRPEVELVDGTRDADAVRREVVERIWRRYAERWR